LTAQEEAQLAAAARMKGIPVKQFAHEFVVEHLPDVRDIPGKAEDTTAQLLAEWDEEDATMTPEEIAIAQAEWDKLKADMNASRAAVDEEPLF
jgi:hypothetical protein